MNVRDSNPTLTLPYINKRTVELRLTNRWSVSSLTSSVTHYWFPSLFLN